MDAKALSEKDKPVISLESATAEVERLMSFYDVSTDEAVLAISKGKLIRACMDGKISIFEVDGDVHVKQVLRREVAGKKELVYEAVSGKSKLAMKGIGQDDSYSNMYAILASLSGLKISDFMDMKSPDLGLSEALSLIFLKG